MPKLPEGKGTGKTSPDGDMSVGGSIGRYTSANDKIPSGGKVHTRSHPSQPGPSGKNGSGWVGPGEPLRPGQGKG